MTTAIKAIFLWSSILILSCTNTNDKSSEADKTDSNENDQTSSLQADMNQSSNEVKQNSSGATSGGDNIVGYWKLSLEAYDNNSNQKLDEEERKKGIRNNYSFRFNADKSCEIMDMFKGHYEIETKDGRKIIRVYRNRVVGEEEKDPAPDAYTITSMSNDELVLLDKLGDLTFWVFKRA